MSGSRAAILLGAVGCALACAAMPVGARSQERLGVAIAIEDPSGRVVPRVREALARAGRGEGVARLAFWGASHTASDQYTGFLRERLQRRFGNAGAGLVMPAMPFDLYARRDVTIEGGPGWRGVMVRGHARTADHYGRAGFAIETSRRTRARVIIPRSRIRHVELWALARTGGGTLELASGRTVSTLATSTSGPDAPVFAELDAERVSTVDVRSAGDGPVRVFGVNLETGTPGVIVESFGVPGARASDQLPWDEATLRAQIARRPLDLVALAYGTNESGDRTAMAALETDLRAVIDRWQRVAPTAACLLIGPSDWAMTRDGARVARPRTTAVRDLYRRVAIAEGCGFFDLVALQGGAGSIPRWVEQGFALGDHVHMTDAGHERVAELLDRALRGR